MIAKPTDWLIAGAAIPIVAAVAVLIIILMGNRRWGLIVTQLGLTGGTFCGVVLATILANGSEPETPIRLMLWNWYSFSLPQAPSIVFGLEATWVKASLMGLTGGLALIALWIANTKKQTPVSDDAILTTSLLYAAGACFIFAPNLPQALIGWGSVSFLAAILIRLSHGQAELRHRPIESGSPRIILTRPNEFANDGQHPALQLVIYAILVIERFFDRTWKAVTIQFPTWLIEQVEVLDNSPVSIQRLAILLGAFAILLTWLL